MDSMAYQWKIDKYPVSAQKAGNELARIESRYGALRPEDVVAESRAGKSVLHKCFNWDDKDAAEKYRISQGQDLICNIVAVKINGKALEAPVRAFVSIERAYVRVSAVIKSGEFTEIMLAQALKELEAFRRKYAALRSLRELFSHIDRAINTADHSENA